MTVVMPSAFKCGICGVVIFGVSIMEVMVYRTFARFIVPRLCMRSKHQVESI